MQRYECKCIFGCVSLCLTGEPSREVEIGSSNLVTHPFSYLFSESALGPQHYWSLYQLVLGKGEVQPGQVTSLGAKFRCLEGNSKKQNFHWLFIVTQLFFLTFTHDIYRYMYNCFFFLSLSFLSGAHRLFFKVPVKQCQLKMYKNMSLCTWILLRNNTWTTADRR